MGHRVALYTIEVRPKRDREYRLLGNFDESGTSVLDLFEEYLRPGFSVLTDDETREFRVEDADRAGEELFVSATHGKSGVRASIVGENGQLRLEQMPADTQLLPCSCLFRLRPQQQLGWLALHINDGRGTKSLLSTGIQERFQVAFPDYVLQIRPYVERQVLDAAIAEDRVDKVTLLKYERPTDEAMAATRQWIPSDAIGKFELTISAKTRGMHVLPSPIRRFLEHDQGARDEIIQFEGVEFDEARVKVTTVDGSDQTFNIEKPDAGHPFTEDLDDLDYEDGHPTGASIREALESAIGRVG